MPAQTKPTPRDTTAPLIWGIILSVVGGGVMVERYWGVAVWDYLWRLWPVLLILLGAKVLVDYYRTPPEER